MLNYASASSNFLESYDKVARTTFIPRARFQDDLAKDRSYTDCTGVELGIEECVQILHQHVRTTGRDRGRALVTLLM